MRARRQDLLRVCQQYERDPSPVTRHDPALDAQSVPMLALEPQAASVAKEAAELYRIQTEDAWGRWLWLVAELVPNGEVPVMRGRSCCRAWCWCRW